LQTRQYSSGRRNVVTLRSASVAALVKESKRLLAGR
jgi:hypothetical protein